MRQHFYAHTPPTSDAAWDDLPHHLRSVATQSSELARAFGGEEYGFLLGLWHDLGKFTTEFQSYLQTAAEKRAHPPAPMREQVPCSPTCCSDKLTLE